MEILVRNSKMTDVQSDSSAVPTQPETPEDSQKSNLEENLDNLDSLDDLEKNFQKVITNLGTDKSLDSFRGEYEKIHAIFLKSHANNAELVKRVRALNSEILPKSIQLCSYHKTINEQLLDFDLNLIKSGEWLKYHKKKKINHAM